MTSEATTHRAPLLCPECEEEIWDLPHGHKLAKCWNTEGHADGGTLAFDTMSDDGERETLIDRLSRLRCYTHSTLYAPGTRVRYLHGGFTGTVVSDMGYDTVLVRWDTHFGVAIDHAPRELLEERS